MATSDSNPTKRVCSVCESEKLIDDFPLESWGRRHQCKSCRAKYRRENRRRETPEQREKRLAYYKEYNDLNQEKIKKYRIEYASANTEKIRQAQRAYYEANAEAIKARSIKWRRDNPALKAEYNKEWAKANKDKMLGYFRASKAKRRQNPRHRLHAAIGSQMRNALASRKAGRKWEHLVGYTVDDLVAHLEKQFTKGMSWDNYGTKWHVDHIIPQVEFEASVCDNAVRECWALTNLRPLCAKENAAKGSKKVHLI